MGRVIDKLDYTQTWVDDIYLALKEKGIKCDEDPLEKIGNEIRKLHVKSEGDSATFGMQTGIRIQPLPTYEFTGEHTKWHFCTGLKIENSNLAIFNTPHDYYRTAILDSIIYSNRKPVHSSDCYSIESEDYNDPIFNTPHDYYRTSILQSFTNTRKTTITTITNEREEI